MPATYRECKPDGHDSGKVMKNERLRKLLTDLNEELHSTRDLDRETRELLRQLNDEIDEIAGSDSDSAIDRAKELESRFAASHPVAERIARELVDALGKMGI